MLSAVVRSKHSITVFLALAPLLAAGQVLAGAADYSFVPLIAQILMADATQSIEIKLVDKTGQLVRGASITRARLDMTPDGMAQHYAPVQLIPTAVPGVYRVDAQYSMTGRWQLNLAAKVAGETETVMGKVVFTVSP